MKKTAQLIANDLASYGYESSVFVNRKEDGSCVFRTSRSPILVQARPVQCSNRTFGEDVVAPTQQMLRS